jgi:predicted ester cyclase
MSPPQQTEEEKNIKIVRRSIEALNSGDVTNVSEFIHPNYFDRDSQSIPGREKLRGSEAFIDIVKKLRAALSELYYKEQEIIASNDKIVSIDNDSYR